MLYGTVITNNIILMYNDKAKKNNTFCVSKSLILKLYL